MRLLACLVVSTTLWISCLHRWFVHEPDVDELAERQLAGPDLALRRTNPEWDLMARMFAVLAFANLAHRDPARYLAAIDALIDRTIADVDQHGIPYFLLPYGRDAERSLFIDGEIALMISTRNRVAPGRDAQPWIDRVVAQIEASPVLLAESYPDEAWVFCNAVALAAIRVHDTNEGVPDRHATLFARWIASARAHAIDPATGLLVSKLGSHGEVREGPEGSTIWLAATMLRSVDAELARDQYDRARAALRGSFAGFGWAREWPREWPGEDDVDSGPTVPLVGANAGSSGLALVAARAFGDDTFANELTTSLGFAGFPDDGHYAAGNHLADAVILYAETLR